MPLLAQIMAENLDVAALVVLVIFFPFFVLFTLRAKGDHDMTLRPVPLYARIQELVAQAAETGQSMHIGIGTGKLGSSTTPELLVGISTLDYVARHAAHYGQSVSATTGDGATLGLAQGVLQRAQADAGFPELYDSRDATYYGDNAMAYAAGASSLASKEPQIANVLIGSFGAEGLWLAEATQQQQTVRLGGTSDVAASALLAASVDKAVIGEDLYAASAYLRRGQQLGSLLAQDLMRVIIILSVLAGVVLTSLGYWG